MPRRRPRTDLWLRGLSAGPVRHVRVGTDVSGARGLCGDSEGHTRATNETGDSLSQREARLQPPEDRPRQTPVCGPCRVCWALSGRDQSPCVCPPSRNEGSAGASTAVGPLRV